MLPLGHVAYTWAGLAWLQSRGRATNVDFRAAAVAALVPDLVDKPLSLTLLSESGTSQGPAHTLLALICNSHLLADQMWKYPRTLFFPLSGRLDSWKFMGSPAAMLSAYAEIVTRPTILAVEAVGLALLGWVVHHGRLHRRSRLARLLRTGRIEMERGKGD
jgi:hypothetical protein